MKKALLLSLIFIGIDQITKHYAIERLTVEWFIIGDWLSFVLQYNEGIAFSISLFNSFIVPLIVFLIVGGTYLAWRYLDWNNAWYRLSFSCIFGGACGNLIDRIHIGQVVDFIKIGWWPVFNVADALICSGVMIIMLLEFKDQFRASSKASNSLQP